MIIRSASVLVTQSHGARAIRVMSAVNAEIISLLHQELVAVG
jgi:hypothetical protein